MRCPTRKPGKYTDQKQDPHMTEDKFNELKRKLDSLRKRRPSLAAEVKELSLTGDYSENAPYQNAKGRLRGLNSRIDETADLLKRAIIISHNENNDRVRIGHEVTVNIDGKEKTYLLLGSSETDPFKNIISHASPLGQALLGREKGESFTIQIAGKEKTCRVVAIK